MAINKMKLLMVVLSMLSLACLLMGGCANTQSASEVKKSQIVVFSSVDNNPDIYHNTEEIEIFNIRAVDDDLKTTWTTWKAQQPGDWLMLDLGKPYKLSQVVLNDSATCCDYPRGFVLEVTDNPPEKSLNDPKLWRIVAEGGKEATGAAGITTINISPPVVTRYFRVRLTAGDPEFWWSVYEIDLK